MTDSIRADIIRDDKTLHILVDMASNGCYHRKKFWLDFDSLGFEQAFTIFSKSANLAMCDEIRKRWDLLQGN